MPFCFGVAGGSAITDGTGKLISCAAGDGRQAIDYQYGLAVCQQCHNNVKFQENIVGAGKIGNQATVLSFIQTNKNSNLRGT